MHLSKVRWLDCDPDYVMILDPWRTGPWSKMSKSILGSNPSLILTISVTVREMMVIEGLGRAATKRLKWGRSLWRVWWDTDRSHLGGLLALRASHPVSTGLRVSAFGMNWFEFSWRKQPVSTCPSCQHGSEPSVTFCCRFGAVRAERADKSVEVSEGEVKVKTHRRHSGNMSDFHLFSGTQAVFLPTVWNACLFSVSSSNEQWKGKVG